MLVGFPIAFYAAASAAYVTYAVTNDRFAFKLGVVANVAGVVGASAAALPGFIDWMFGIDAGDPAKATGFDHMLLNVTALILFTVNAFLQFNAWNDASPPIIGAIALSAMGMALTITAGILGWQMVREHYVGAVKRARIERMIHNHLSRSASTLPPRRASSHA